MARGNFREITALAVLKDIMTANGVVRLYVKYLSPNDNSKNQVYLGSDFQALNVIPNHGVTVDAGREGSKRDRFKAFIDMLWIDAEGRLCPAPGAQLILYPKYPEVRMSGFLKGCECAPSEMMQSRLEKRLMFLGIRDDGKIVGHVTGPNNPLYAELAGIKHLEESGVFLNIPLTALRADTKQDLITALRNIHCEGWIESVRLCSNGSIVPCRSSNCGGYTLESKLGISPNGYSEPDFLGWEIKQHGVKSLARPHSGSPITLFTPEPTAGMYKEKGVEYFIRKFGYPDRNGRDDRMNFGGIYRYGHEVALTGLTLHLTGYDAGKGKIVNPDGGITLLNSVGEEAATWRYADLMDHWNRKHAQAAYIPSLRKMEPMQQYCYGNVIELGHGTDFLKLLEALSKGIVYYDPGIKLENASTAMPVTKRRSQFRIKPSDLSALYHKMEIVDVLA